MRDSLIAFACLFFSSLPLASAAQPTVIDFETLSRGEIVNDQYADLGLHVTASNWSIGPDIAVIFDTTDIGLSDDQDLAAPLDPSTLVPGLASLWPGNVLILQEWHDCSDAYCTEPDDEATRPAGWIEFRFDQPVTLHSMTLLDINYEAGEEPNKLLLYNTSGDLIDAVDIPGVGGQNDWRPWNIEQSGIVRARLHLPGDGAIDNVSFTPDVPAPPVFESRPPVAVATTGTYLYEPVVSDPDGDAITLSLLIAPSGMSVTSDGVLAWQPNGQEGVFTVSLQASDGQFSTVQTFDVHATDQFTRALDFELETGIIVDDEFLQDGVFVRARNLSQGGDLAVVFDTTAPTGGDTDLQSPFAEGYQHRAGLGFRFPGKVLILHENNDCDVLEIQCQNPDDEFSEPAGWIEFAFVQPAHVWSVDVFDVTSDAPVAMPIELYDAGGNRLDSGLTLARTGGYRWNRQVIDVQDVVRMRVNLDGDGALDNLRYSLVGAPGPDDQRPYAAGDSYELGQNGALQVPAPGVLSNDIDIEGQPLTAQPGYPALHGIVQLNADGSFSYMPGPEFNGSDHFTYYARDPHSISDEVAVVLTMPPTPPPSILMFTANPVDIAPGEPSMLDWSVSGATTISIQPGAITGGATGTASVTPMQTTSYTLTASNAQGTATANVTVNVNAALAPPVIDVTTPVDGTLLAESQPEIQVQYANVGNGVDFATLTIRLDGQAMALSCQHTATSSTCVPDSGIADGAHELSAQVSGVNSKLSNIDTAVFHIDSTPPANPDPQRIQIVQIPPGTVTITGSAGAVEPGAIIEASIGSIVFTAVAGSSGDFSLVVSGTTGDILLMTATDAAGNVSGVEAFTVPAVPLIVTITAPADATIIHSTTTAVSGTHNGPYGTGVTVNGYAAAVAADGTFFVPELPVSEGSNSITATATAPDGETATASITVEVAAVVPPVLMIRAEQPQAPAPHTTMFEVLYAGSLEDIQRIDLDYNGDGTPERQTGNLFEEFSHEYLAPGIYHPEVTVVTGAASHTATTTLVVEDPAVLDAYLQSRWSDMMDGLQSGDTEKALVVMSPGAQKRFGPLFEAILPFIQQGLSSWQPPQLVSLKGNLAEYLIIREHNGKQYGYPVLFQRMNDGIWKLSTM